MRNFINYSHKNLTLRKGYSNIGPEKKKPRKIVRRGSNKNQCDNSFLLEVDGLDNSFFYTKTK